MIKEWFHNSSGIDRQIRKNISNSDLIELNKLVKEIQYCMIDENDQILTIMRNLQISVNDLQFMQNKKFHKFYQKNCLSLSKKQILNFFDKENKLIPLSQNEQNSIYETCKKYNFKINLNSTCKSNFKEKMIFKEYYDILNMDPAFMETVKKMLEFNPHSRIDPSALKACKKNF